MDENLARPQVAAPDSRSFINLKSSVLRELRAALYALDFVELATPVVRRADDRFRPRPIVEFQDRRYLREAIGPALRLNLEHCPRVFEIGPCFRFDAHDDDHASEFIMLDLYATDEGMEFLLNLATSLAKTAYPGEVERVSVADLLDDSFGVDPSVADEEALRTAMVEQLRLSAVTSLYGAVEEFATRTLVPMSTGKAILFYDFPTGTEVCARPRSGATSILNRFEMYINGIEVVHGYEDDDDSDRFIALASEIGFFNAEQQRVHERIREGRIPKQSVGLGIGIERLCMASTPGSTVHDFLFSSEC